MGGAEANLIKLDSTMSEIRKEKNNNMMIDAGEKTEPRREVHQFPL